MEVFGEEQFRQFAKNLRQAADKDLKRETIRALNRGSKIGREAVKDSIPTYMPSGYTPVLAGSLRMRTGMRGGTWAGVSVTAKAKGNPRPRRVGDLNRGRLRKPLFGNRDHWFDQTIRPGFFTEPMGRNASEMAREIAKGLHVVAEKIARL